MTIAQEVHNEIDNSIECLLEKIKAKSIDEYLGHFTKDKFRALVEKYKLKYPQNPFITEKQVRDICLKHSLKLGSEFAFIGEIPVKNKKEIESFVRPNCNAFDYALFENEINEGYILKSISESFRGITRYNYEARMITLVGAVRGLSPNKFVLPLSKNVAIYQNWDDREDVQMCCGEFTFSRLMGGTSLIIQDDCYNCVLISLPSNFIDVSQVTESHEDFMTASFSTTMEVQFNLSAITDVLQHAIQCRKGNQQRKVIAPSELFNTTALKEVDGYRYALDELTVSKDSVFVDDPIILEPVEGGYLVVTKWGGESELIENGGAN